MQGNLEKEMPHGLTSCRFAKKCLSLWCISSHMKQNVRIILIFCFTAIILAAACRRSDFEHQVQRAETLMESTPDSALAIAQALKPDSRAERARAALLLTKARYKAYVPLTDDSLINIAAEHYAGSGDSLEIQALFFQGETFFTLDMFDKAILAAKKAEYTAKNNDCRYYLALSQRLQAETYMMCYNFEEELVSREKASRNFSLAGKQNHMLWENASKFLAMQRLGMTNQSIDSINQFIDETQNISEDMMVLLLRTQAINFYYSNKYIECIDLLKQIGGNNLVLSSQDYSLFARAYSEINQIENAKKMLIEAEKTQETAIDSCCFLLAKSMINERNGNFKLAYYQYLKHDSIIGSKMDQLLTHPFTNLLAENYRLETEYASFKNKQLKNGAIIWSLISLLIITILTIGVLYYKRTSELNQLKIDKVIIELNSLKHELQNLRKETGSLISDRDSLLKQQISSINLICSEAFKIPQHKKEEKINILNRLYQVIATFKEPAILAYILDYLNRNYQNVVHLWDSECSTLSPKQRTLFIFCAIGLSNEAIAILTDSSSVNGVLSAKSRLKRAVEALDFSKKELIISLISSYKKKLNEFLKV